MTTTTLRNDDVVRARVDPSLKREAVRVLDSIGISVSDLMRETLVRVVQDGAVPFTVRTRTGVVSPETKRKLDAMFLPELHQTRWAEGWAQLEDQRKVAATPAEAEAIKAQIREHFKHRFDVEQTRRELEARYAPQAKPKRARER